MHLWIITSNSVATLDPVPRKVCLQVQFPWQFILPVLLRSLIVLCMNSDILCLNSSIPWQQNILGQDCLPSSAYNKLQKMTLSLLMCGCVQCSSVPTEDASALPVASWLVSKAADNCPGGVFTVTRVFCTQKKKNSEIHITFLNCCPNLGIIAFRHYLWQKFSSLPSRAVGFLCYVWLTWLFEDQTSATVVIAPIKHNNGRRLTLIPQLTKFASLTWIER